jgi:hypothetical protein
MTKNYKKYENLVVFLQICDFMRVCVTQITKIEARNLLQSLHYTLMGFLYWETRLCLINFEKEKVNEMFV